MWYSCRWRVRHRGRDAERDHPMAERTLDEIAAALPEKVRNKLLRNQVTTSYPMDQMVKSDVSGIN